MKGILLFLGFLVLFGIPTALVPSPWFARMTSPTTADYLFLTINSALLALYIVRRYQHHGTATAGTCSNIFAISCPLCNKLLIALIGASAVLTYVEPMRIWLGIASTLLLLFAIRKA